MNLEAFVILFFGSFLLAVPAVLSPGPVAVAVVNESTQRGAWVGPLVTLGHAAAEMVIVTLIALGLTNVLQLSILRLLIAFGGGAFLIWMGGSMIWGAWRGTVRLPTAGAGDAPAMVPAQMVGLGLSATLSNPFWFIWWVTVGAGILLGWQSELGLLAAPVFFAGHILADLGWNTFLAAAAAAGRRWLTDRRYRALIAVTSLFLVYVGVSFLVEGGSMLVG
ncbi:MAG: LysE family transporter [Anaerolineae bacterium]|nr:LysE family transporter [Anaerolineae bacterium]